MRRSGLDRAWVGVVADELRVRESLRYQHRGDAVAAPDIRDASTAFKLGNDTIEGRKSLAHEMILIAWTEEPSDSAEHARALVAPCDAAAILESWCDLFEIGVDRSHT